MDDALIPPTAQSLNEIAEAVPPNEIPSLEVQQTIDAMLRLAAGKGIHKSDTRQMVGLAAPQVGVQKRIIIIDLTATGAHQKQHMQVCINPVITYCSPKKVDGREGCWSCSNICGIVARSYKVTLEAIDRRGGPVKMALEDFVARIAQHEVDHLDGIRFPDRITDDQRLHWVEPDCFEDYRTQWAAWPVKCPRARWMALKNGTSPLG